MKKKKLHPIHPGEVLLEHRATGDVDELLVHHRGL